jgi:hypothetical protein
MAENRIAAETRWGEYPVWWTHCTTCDISVTVRHERHGLEDPDEAVGLMDCPYCDVPLTGWNGDLRQQHNAGRRV